VTVHEILKGRLDHTPSVTDPVFGFEVPQRCGEVSPELLTLRHTWKDPAAYDTKARELGQRFIKNFEQYADNAPDIAAGGGPRL